MVWIELLEQLKSCSRGTIVTAIYLSQLVGCMVLRVIVVTTLHERLHWIPYNP